MVVFYWIFGAIVLGGLVFVMTAFLGPKPIPLFVRDKLFPKAQESIGKDEDEPIFLDDEGMMYVIKIEDKRALAYRADSLLEVSDVYDGETVKKADNELILQNFTLSFSDGYTHTVSFDEKENALSHMNKLRNWQKKFSFSNSSPAPSLNLDVSEHIAEHLSKIKKIMTPLGLGAFAILIFGHVYFFYESQSSKQERLAQEKASVEQSIQRSCTNPNEAISYSRQLIRNATTGSISFIRNSDRGRLIGDCEFRVMGAIDGTNAFGGPVRNYYVITMEGRRRGDEIRWYGSTPVINHDQSFIRQLYEYESDSD